MHNFSISNILELTQIASDFGACASDLNMIKSQGSVNNIISHPRAPYWAFWYAYNVLKHRWVEGEDIICRSPHFIYQYSKDVIRGPWLEGEEFLKKSRRYSYLYDRDIIRAITCDIGDLASC